jgi:hypothetical protein
MVDIRAVRRTTLRSALDLDDPAIQRVKDNFLLTDTHVLRVAKLFDKVDLDQGGTIDIVRNI